MSKLGVMEGRLLPPERGLFQAFPRVRWAEEFDLARQVPLSYIEWIYDGYGADVNPLVHDVSRLTALIDESGISVRSICADVFMEKPFIRCSESEYAERQQLLEKLVGIAGQIGAMRLVIPFVDNAQIVSARDIDDVVRMLDQAANAARATGVELHLEASLDPYSFRSLLDRLPDPVIKVNYDTGNSSALGYRVKEEFEAYGNRIGSVHIKDRKVGAGSVPLGSGHTDFATVFASLRDLRYTGDFTLQVARSRPGEEVSWARASRAFVAARWPLE